MTKKVAVSSAQKAAVAMVKRGASSGRAVSKSVHKIANAKTQPRPASSR